MLIDTSVRKALEAKTSPTLTVSEECFIIVQKNKSNYSQLYIDVPVGRSSAKLRILFSFLSYRFPLHMASMANFVIQLFFYCVFYSFKKNIFGGSFLTDTQTCNEINLFAGMLSKC